MRTRARKRKQLLQHHPEYGMADQRLFAAYVAQGVAKGRYEAERARLIRAAKDDKELKAATQAVWQARVAMCAADDQLVRMRWWDHITKRVEL